LPAARAKNNRQHQIPLSEQALDVLRLVCPESGLTNSHDLVFQPVSFSRGKAKLDAEVTAGAGIKLPPWTLHDLRQNRGERHGEPFGVRIETVERILNHASGSFRGIVSVYQRYDFASEKRAALDLWGAHVTALVSSGGAAMEPPDKTRPVALAAAAYGEFRRAPEKCFKIFGSRKEIENGLHDAETAVGLRQDL
jgi:hypothetical protein